MSSWIQFSEPRSENVLTGYKTDNLNHPLQKAFSKSVERLSRNRNPNMTQSEHVYTICCRPEVDKRIKDQTVASTLGGDKIGNTVVEQSRQFSHEDFTL